MKDWLVKIRALPVHQKHYILWGTVIVFGLVLAVWWAQGVASRIRKVERVDIPGLDSVKDPDTWQEIDRPWSGWSLDELFPQEETLEEIETPKEDNEQNREPN